MSTDPITPHQAGQIGLSRTGLYRRVRIGEFEQIGPGLYRRVDAPAADLDLIEIAARRPEATLCLTSALAHHDLTDIIPSRIDIAIPRGMRRSVTDAPVSWHTFDRATFDIGRGTMRLAGTSLDLGIYSPERSIVDAFRLRGSQSYELARDVLRSWLREGGKPADLIAIARLLPRAEGPIRQMLDVLQ